MLMSVLASSIAFADEGLSTEWPQFRGPARDGHTPVDLPPWPETGPHEVWRQAIGPSFAGVVVTDGKLLTLSSDDENELAVRLDPQTGEELWRTTLAPVFVNEFGNGPRSTPTIDGERVFLSTAQGVLFALDMKDGSVLWTKDLMAEYGGKPPRFGYSASALIEGDLLLIEAGGTNGHAIVALDKATGELRWHALDGATGYSSPLPVEIGGVRQILFARRIKPAIVSLLPDGTVHWSHDGIPTITMPLFLPPNKIFLSDGSTVAYGALFELTSADGKPQLEELWQSQRMRNHFNTSVAIDNHIYGFDNATLKCFDAATGEQKWAKRGFGKGSVVAAGDQLVVLGDNGILAVANVDPERYVEVGRLQALTGKSWTAPAIADGRIYLRNLEEITCYDLKTASTKTEIETEPNAEAGR